jgi:hypothetical protein
VFRMAGEIVDRLVTAADQESLARPPEGRT